MTDTPGPTRSKKLETSALIEEVSDRLFLPTETIETVLNCLIEVMSEALVKDEKVILRTFGSLRVKHSNTRLSVKFRPSQEFRLTLREALLPMDKYGVEMNNEATLMAKVTGDCPACKGKLDQTDPPHCPSCGTAPFEKKDSRQDAMKKNFDILYGKEEG
jgi:nucleoid DNA-binding protein